MTTLFVTRGLPGSGKSTWANQTVLEAEAGKMVRVNRDSLRLMLHAGRFKGGRTEQSVTDVRNAVIVYALQAGKDVICDDTNLAPSVMNELQTIADRAQVSFVIKDFTDVPLETCIKRDLQRDASVGKDVIMGMHNRYLRQREEYKHDTTKPSAIIVDMDGTLALFNHNRGPYDDHLCGTDEPNWPVMETVFRAMDAHKVIVVSGRDAGRSRDATEGWLLKHGVSPIEKLLMRAAGDKRKDSIVKRELYDAEIRDQYDIQFVLDDRNSVVEMWRDLGLTVFQVAEGDF